MTKNYFTSDNIQGLPALHLSKVPAFITAAPAYISSEPQLTWPKQQIFHHENNILASVPCANQAQVLDPHHNTNHQLDSIKFKAISDYSQADPNTHDPVIDNVSNCGSEGANTPTGAFWPSSGNAYPEKQFGNSTRGAYSSITYNSAPLPHDSFAQPNIYTMSDEEQLIRHPIGQFVQFPERNNYWHQSKPQMATTSENLHDSLHQQSVQGHGGSFYANPKNQISASGATSCSNFTGDTSVYKASMSPSEHHKAQSAAEEAFQILIPTMSTIGPANYIWVLMEISKNCEDHVPIDHIYDVLYNSEHTTGKNASTKRFHVFNISQPSHFESKGLKLIFLILSFLRSPKDTICHMNGMTLDKLRMPEIDLQDFSSSLLAIRITKSMIIEVKESPVYESYLSRDSIYRAYSLVCQKLCLQHQSTISSRARAKRIITSHSQLRKIFRLVFPESPRREMRRKGDTQLQYKGYVWNNEVVDNTITQMLLSGEEDILVSNENLATRPSRLSSDGARIPHPILQPNILPLIPVFGSSTFNPVIPLSNSPIRPPTIPPITPPSSITSTLCSFVNKSMLFPKKDCTPRDWTCERGKIPRHSKWATALITKSSNVINRYGVRCHFFIRNFKAGDFSEGGARSLPVAVFDAITRLKKLSAPSNVFLHLYRTVIVLVFPAIIASDSEITSQENTGLGNCLKKMASILDSDSLFNSEDKASDFRKFIEVIRKMSRLAELKSGTIRTEIFERAVQILRHNIDMLEIADDGRSRRAGVSDDAFFTSLNTLTMKFGFDLPVLAEENQDEEKIQRVLRQVARTLTGHMKSLQEGFIEILHDFHEQHPKTPTKALAHGIFVKKVQIIHRETLQDPYISRLPMSVLRFVLLQLMVQIQNMSFHEFGNEGPELSRKCFETWYISSALTHEYLGILCEVIALSQILP